jgi:hypothetical protein
MSEDLEADLSAEGGMQTSLFMLLSIDLASDNRLEIESSSAVRISDSPMITTSLEVQILG